MAKLTCMPLKQVTDGPLFSAGPGTLAALVNMNLEPDGYAEARGGLEELKPLGGTSADPITQGGYMDALQMSTSYGWVRAFDDSAGQYSKNYQLSQGGFLCFTVSTSMAANDCMFWGADLPFSGIGLSLAQAGAWGAPTTFVYEYWNGAWTALTAAITIDFTALRTPQFAYWTLPSDWVANTIGDATSGRILKYWMRIRCTQVTAITASPIFGRLQGFWTGMRELYVATQNPRSAAGTGKLARLGQNGTTSEWLAVDNTTSYSANASPARLAEYRGRVIMVNGKDIKRWDGYNFADLGPETSGFTVNIALAAGGSFAAGQIFRYYVALGNGPCQNVAAYADRQDADPLYGWGKAIYVTELPATALNDRVQIEIPGGVVATSSCVAIYRTDDLANVPAADRGNYPAYMINSFRIANGSGLGAPAYEQNIGIALNYYYDTSLAYVFPLKEAKNFDIYPPGIGTTSFAASKPKYIAIYQNRLFLADDETIYWSDPFTPDIFSLKTTTGYIKLARQWGGRHMNIIEHADQLVAFTEDQTWGITNVDLDVPQLYPIHAGVGCVAPDSAASANGLLVWMSRDGFYAWDGSKRLPVKISKDMDNTFKNLCFEGHGGSKGIIYNGYYLVRFATPSYTAGQAWQCNLRNGQWQEIQLAGFSSTLFPLAAIHAPLGNNDAGVLHPLWGKVDYGTGAGEYTLFLGELTTQDNGANYTCSADMHFPIEPGRLASPTRAIAYYQAADGWGTPALSYLTASPLASSPGSMNSGTPDTGTDYSMVGGTFSSAVQGTSDIKVRFSVSSAASGTVNGQRFFGALVEAAERGVRRGAI